MPSPLPSKINPAMAVFRGSAPGGAAWGGAGPGGRAWYWPWLGIGRGLLNLHSPAPGGQGQHEGMLWVSGMQAMCGSTRHLAEEVQRGREAGQGGARGQASKGSPGPPEGIRSALPSLEL